MLKFRIGLASLILSLVCGCTTVTNLTPSKQSRNATGLYPVEVQWDTREQAIRPESLQPTVMIGLQSYAMKPTPLMHNRWETLLPVPADQNSVRYRFKFDYETAAIPTRRKDSKMSREYKLEIVEPGANKRILPPESKPDQQKASEAIKGIQ